MELGERIRTLRKLQKMTLKNVAENASLSVSYISDIETGRTNPSLDTLKSLSTALNVDVVTLLSEVDGMTAAPESVLNVWTATCLEIKRMDIEIERMQANRDSLEARKWRYETRMELMNIPIPEEN